MIVENEADVEKAFKLINSGKYVVSEEELMNAFDQGGIAESFASLVSQLEAGVPPSSVWDQIPSNSYASVLLMEQIEVCGERILKEVLEESKEFSNSPASREFENCFGFRKVDPDLKNVRLPRSSVR